MVVEILEQLAIFDDSLLKTSVVIRALSQCSLARLSRPVLIRLGPPSVSPISVPDGERTMHPPGLVDVAPSPGRRLIVPSAVIPGCG